MSSTVENKLKNAVYEDFLMAKELLFGCFGSEALDLQFEEESLAYGACTFIINTTKIKHRTAKITPAKTGQFVTLWKRNELGATAPLDSTDDFDCIIITAKKNKRTGFFIFPKPVLIFNQIISHKNKVGKMGIRLYPSWDIATNRQAQKAQKWQSAYFFNAATTNVIKLEKIKTLLSKI